jgi:hypothetical protein
MASFIPLLGMDEIWVRLPDSAIAQLDRSVVAKYLPAQVQAATAGRSDNAKSKASSAERFIASRLSMRKVLDRAAARRCRYRL